MRKDVVDGVLRMYGYADRPVSPDKEAMARKLVTETLRGSDDSPWSLNEEAMMERIKRSLIIRDYTLNEVLDVVITCVYDAHVLGWASGSEEKLLSNARWVTRKKIREIAITEREESDALMELYPFKVDDAARALRNDYQFEYIKGCLCEPRRGNLHFYKNFSVADSEEKQHVRAADRNWAYTVFSGSWMVAHECHHDWYSIGSFLYFLTPEEHKAYHHEFGR